MRGNTLERGEMVEQRIAWLRNQYSVARVAQQLEQPRIGLAGAGGQHDLRRVDAGAAAPLIVRHRRASRWQTEWLRVVVKRLGTGERVEQSRRVGDAAARRVRFRQIDNR